MLGIGPHSSLLLHLQVEEVVADGTEFEGDHAYCRCNCETELEEPTAGSRGQGTGLHGPCATMQSHLEEFVVKSKKTDHSHLAEHLLESMEDLAISFEGTRQLSAEACADFFHGRDWTVAQQENISHQLETASEIVLQKLQKYLTDGQPGIHLLKDVLVFNSSKLCPLSEDLKTLNPCIVSHR